MDVKTAWDSGLIVVLLAVIVIAIIALYSAHDKRRRKREIAAGKAKWVRAVLRAESEGFEAVLAVDGTPKTRLVEPYSETELKAVAAYQNAEKDRRDAQLRDLYFDADQPVYALKALVRAIGDYRDLEKLFGLATHQAVTNRVVELILDQLVRCRNGNEWAVSAYRDFVRFAAGDGWNSRMYEVFGVDQPGFPIDWDGLVLSTRANYTLEDLRGAYANEREVTEAAAALLEPPDGAPASRLKNVLAYVYAFKMYNGIALDLERALLRIKNG